MGRVSLCYRPRSAPARGSEIDKELSSGSAQLQASFEEVRVQQQSSDNTSAPTAQFTIGLTFTHDSNRLLTYCRASDQVLVFQLRRGDVTSDVLGEEKHGHGEDARAHTANGVIREDEESGEKNRKTVGPAREGSAVRNENESVAKNSIFSTARSSASRWKSAVSSYEKVEVVPQHSARPSTTSHPRSTATSTRSCPRRPSATRPHCGSTWGGGGPPPPPNISSWRLSRRLRIVSSSLAQSTVSCLHCEALEPGFCTISPFNSKWLVTSVGKWSRFWDLFSEPNKMELAFLMESQSCGRFSPKLHPRTRGYYFVDGTGKVYNGPTLPFLYAPGTPRQMGVLLNARETGSGGGDLLSPAVDVGGAGGGFLGGFGGTPGGAGSSSSGETGRATSGTTWSGGASGPGGTSFDQTGLQYEKQHLIRRWIRKFPGVFNTRDRHEHSVLHFVITNKEVLKLIFETCTDTSEVFTPRPITPTCWLYKRDAPTPTLRLWLHDVRRDVSR